ncbi:MAG TPA: CehA/McbA family metallohydrolase [Kofleriaceae bacterium]|nr:CehA/McbA family metallohydrolase [Kofleriaceae bacterium]
MHALVLTALTAILPLDVISTLPLEGDVTADGGDFARIPFDVPDGTVEIRYHHDDNSEADILDFGMRDPSGQRGWCGGLTDDDVIGVEESSRCYMPGPIEGGSTWYVEIGKAQLVSDSVHYSVELEFRDAATLTPRPRAEFQPVVLESGARWYAGDFHVHSNESGDATSTFDQIRDLARARGVDFVNLSDHNVITQHALIAAYQAGVDDVLFLRGSEVTTYAGHGNAVGNASYIDHHIGQDGRTIVDLIDDVVADGALFIVNHPALNIGDACIGCGWNYDDTPWDEVTGIELQTGPYLFSGVFTPLVLTMWDDLLDSGYRITGVSGSDDHQAPTAPADDESQLGTPTSMVWAEELSEAGVMEGVRAGRVVVKLRGPDDPMLELTAETDRGERGMIGDTVTGHHVSLTASVAGEADGMQLVLMRNGEMDEVVPVEGSDFTHTFERDTRSEGDRYRVHLTLGGDVVITNHVWVEDAEPTGGDDAGSGGGPDAGTGAPGGDDGGCGCRAGASRGGGAGGALLLAAAALIGLRRRRSTR